MPRRAWKSNEVSAGAGGCGDRGLPGVIIITHRKLHLSLITSHKHMLGRDTGNNGSDNIQFTDLFLLSCKESKEWQSLSVTLVIV